MSKQNLKQDHIEAFLAQEAAEQERLKKAQQQQKSPLTQVPIKEQEKAAALQKQKTIDDAEQERLFEEQLQFGQVRRHPNMISENDLRLKEMQDAVLQERQSQGRGALPYQKSNQSSSQQIQLKPATLVTPQQVRPQPPQNSNQAFLAQLNAANSTLKPAPIGGNQQVRPPASVNPIGSNSQVRPPPPVNPIGSNSQVRPPAPVKTQVQLQPMAPRPPVQIKFPTPVKGTKRVARPPAFPTGGRGPIKATLSGKAAPKAQSMAEQLQAASQKLQKVDPPAQTAPNATPKAPQAMTLQEQLLEAQSRMKKAPVPEQQNKPQASTPAVQQNSIQPKQPITAPTPVQPKPIQPRAPIAAPTTKPAPTPTPSKAPSQAVQAIIPLVTKQSVAIKFPTPAKGTKRVARPPAFPTGGRGPIKATLSGKAAPKAQSMAEQLQAASQKLQKVDPPAQNAPVATTKAPQAMTLQEQLLEAQSRMKKAPVSEQQNKPPASSPSAVQQNQIQQPSLQKASTPIQPKAPFAAQTDKPAPTITPIKVSASAGQAIIPLVTKQPVAIKFPTPAKGTKRVAKPPAFPTGGRGPIKATLSGKAAPKAQNMAEQLQAASLKLQKVETIPTSTSQSTSSAPPKAMTLQEQLLEAQSKMKKAPSTAGIEQNKPPVQSPTPVTLVKAPTPIQQNPVPSKVPIAAPKPALIKAPASAAQAIIPLVTKQPVAIKFPTPAKGTKRVAKPPAFPTGGRGPIKATLSGKAAPKAQSMAEQLQAASQKLQKVETIPTSTSQSASSAPSKAMTLQEQLLEAQSRMKKAPGTAGLEQNKPTAPIPAPKTMTMQEQLLEAQSKMKPVPGSQQTPAPLQKTPTPVQQNPIQPKAPISAPKPAPIKAPAPAAKPIIPLVPRPPVAIKVPTPAKGTKRVAQPPPFPSGGRGQIKATLSGKAAPKALSMAEQLQAASQKLQKVETPAATTQTTAPKAMSLQEQLQAQQAKMKPVGSTPKPLPPKELSFAEQIAQANANLKPVNK